MIYGTCPFLQIDDRFLIKIPAGVCMTSCCVSTNRFVLSLLVFRRLKKFMDERELCGGSISFVSSYYTLVPSIS